MSTFINDLQAEKKIDIIHWQTLNKDAKMMQYVKTTGVEVYTNHLSWFRTLYKQKNSKKSLK